MSIFLKAATESLKRFPDINASIDGSDVVYHGYCDIGVAVSSERGLVVPVLRNTEFMSLAVNGEVVIRPMMYIALSYDHRIVDGKGAVGFLKTIKELVEDPARIVFDL
ncbi:UNVERIFIED_CONTAM: hypothetical protein GTU68_036582 [Idotea baltica]|nr:hypothetical protein [Idotea baltica]